MALRKVRGALQDNEYPHPISLVFFLFFLPTGEGGTFALMQGLFPKHDTDEEDRTLTGDSTRIGSWHDGIRGRRFLDAARWPLVVWSLFGTALTLSDGIFTPGELW